jgi:hypothetical protein
MKFLKTIINRRESYIMDEPIAYSDKHDRLSPEDRDFADWIGMVLSRLDQMDREDNE